MLPYHSIETFWTHEWPGIRLVIFTQGCNFKCKYCQNPDTIPLKSKPKLIGIDEIKELIEKEKPYFGENGGITFSWWEPTLHAKKLIPICKEIKKMGIHITIDTNGSIFNDNVKELANIVDLFLPDIKHIDDEMHKKLTRSSNQNTLKFIKYLNSIKKHFRIRHVLVPWYNTDEKRIIKLWEFIQDLKYLDRIEILPYHELWKYKRKELWREYELKDIQPQKNETTKNTQKILEKYTKKVIIRWLISTNQPTNSQ